MLLQHIRVAATDRDEPDRSALEHCLPVAYELERATASGNTLTQAFIHTDVSSILFGLDRFPRHSNNSRQTVISIAGLPREVTSQVLWIGLIVGRPRRPQQRLLPRLPRAVTTTRTATDSTAKTAATFTRLETDARAALGDTNYNAARDDAGGFKDATNSRSRHRGEPAVTPQMRRPPQPRSPRGVIDVAGVGSSPSASPKRLIGSAGGGPSAAQLPGLVVGFAPPPLEADARAQAPL